jgi:hypothetical protein
VHTPNLDGATWRKSSFSGENGSCIEIKRCMTSTRGGIRDSKNPSGGHLEVSLGALIAIAKSR